MGLIQGLLDSKWRDDETHPLSDVRLLAPLPLPLQMRDALCFEAHLVNTLGRARESAGALNYSDRQREMLAAFRTRPFWYKCNRFSVAGTGVDVRWPASSALMDYELEIAMVVGTTGKNIAVADAPSFIFGYTIFNDFSARDLQVAEMSMLGPAKSKDFDNGNILGPCIVTPDEFDPSNATMAVRINGEVVSAGNSGAMYFSFPELISYVSRDETLRAGEIICSGTVGRGCGQELGRYLTNGDLVELEVGGIGKIANRVLSSG